MKVVLLFVFLICFSHLHAQTNPIQKQALLDFFNGTNGAKWINPWPVGNATSDPCLDNWLGIKCTGYNIFSLSLQGNSLSGTLPESLTQISTLQFLYLSRNQITGSIPQSYGKLVSLVQLGLDQNFLTGTVPSSLSNLFNLQSLFFQDNQFTGSLDFLAGMQNIQYLYLSRNRLSGTIPAVVGNFRNLQQIGLDTNLVSGTIPSGLGVNQNALQAVYFQNNQITGILPRSLCSVGICDASGNAFSCPLPGPSCCKVSACAPSGPSSPLI
eukprot:TRINITY_DN668_c0_g1_i2.p1 TRINITY_DN668_c0_g1~~TRINITY_DN668_c0_g1_i2.p1  ORF type:complete len:269 (-),score=32.91 TRINITY_DN668_c0_g1_i2:106-912(-)